MTTQALATLEPLTPGADLDAYKRNVNSIPMLTAEEEKQLAERVFFDNDVDAARRLVISHLRFVVHIARTYSGYGLPMADLIQEGNVGLMKALRRFDPTVGVRLVSFAVHWIRAEIHEYILKNWRIVKVATTKAQRKLFFNLRKAKKNLQWFNESEIHSLADSLGVASQDVRQMEARMSLQDASIDKTSDSGEYEPGQEIILSTDNNPEHIVSQNLRTEADESALTDAISQLDDRSRDILEKRWLNDRKTTLHELAGFYNVSSERIRQIEKSAFKKLKGLIEPHK